MQLSGIEFIPFSPSKSFLILSFSVRHITTGAKPKVEQNTNIAQGVMQMTRNQNAASYTSSKHNSSHHPHSRAFSGDLSFRTSLPLFVGFSNTA